MWKVRVSSCVDCDIFFCTLFFCSVDWLAQKMLLYIESYEYVEVCDVVRRTHVCSYIYWDSFFCSLLTGWCKNIPLQLIVQVCVKYVCTWVYNCESCENRFWRRVPQHYVTKTYFFGVCTAYIYLRFWSFYIYIFTLYRNNIH